MRENLFSNIKSYQSLLMIIITLGYLLGTHLSTINSLKVALVSKAEQAEMDMLDKKLTRIEVKLEEAIMTKKEFYEMRERIEEKIMDLTVRLKFRDERNADVGK